MTLRRLFAVLALTCCADAAVAQTVNAKIAWDYDRTISVVQSTYTQTVKVDDVIVPGPITCVTHATLTSKTTCTISAALPTTIGQHTLSVLAVTTSGQSAETRFTGLDVSAALTVDGKPRISVVVTVTLP